MSDFLPVGNPTVDIPSLIRWRGNGLTFVELLHYLPYLKGDHLYWVGNRNIIAWMGVSKECVDTLQNLLLSNAINVSSTPPLTYYIDGCALNMPLARSNKNYKKPHWLPVTFSIPKTAAA